MAPFSKFFTTLQVIFVKETLPLESTLVNSFCFMEVVTRRDRILVFCLTSQVVLILCTRDWSTSLRDRGLGLPHMVIPVGWPELPQNLLLEA